MIDHTKTIEALTLELDKAVQWEYEARRLSLQTIAESSTAWTPEQWRNKMLEAWHGEAKATDLEQPCHYMEALSTITTGDSSDRT